MTAPKEILDFLNKKEVNYELLEHPVAYTAQEIADKMHIPGGQVVKAVIVNADERLIMCVLPGIHVVDFDSLKQLTGTQELSLTQEDEIAKFFPEYEVGAAPPPSVTSMAWKYMSTPSLTTTRRSSSTLAPTPTWSKCSLVTMSASLTQSLRNFVPIYDQKHWIIF